MTAASWHWRGDGKRIDWLIASAALVLETAGICVIILGAVESTLLVLRRYFGSATTKSERGGLQVFMRRGCYDIGLIRTSARQRGPQIRSPLSCAPGQVDVFGIVMGSHDDRREIQGVQGTEEPCLKGYERNFEQLDLIIGYNRDGRVRRIVTRNPLNSIFGIHPGDAADAARASLRAAGFTEISRDRFVKDEWALSILTDRRTMVCGVALEVLDGK